MSISKYRIQKILQTFHKLYPKVETQLFHNNPFQLLIATILSAQCTDNQVNSVTPKLFQTFSDPKALANAKIKDIEKLIHSTGFFHNKAKNIKNCAKMLLTEYKGIVPKEIEKLIILPGVGRKTANVVRSAAFKIPSVVVDTHVGRLAKRIGFTQSDNPVIVERDIMELVPRKYWNDLGLQMIYHGRAICTSRKAKCSECDIKTWCEYGKNREE